MKRHRETYKEVARIINASPRAWSTPSAAMFEQEMFETMTESALNEAHSIPWKFPNGLRNVYQVVFGEKICWTEI